MLSQTLPVDVHQYITSKKERRQTDCRVTDIAVSTKIWHKWYDLFLMPGWKSLPVFPAFLNKILYLGFIFTSGLYFAENKVLQHLLFQVLASVLWYLVGWHLVCKNYFSVCWLIWLELCTFISCHCRQLLCLLLQAQSKMVWHSDTGLPRLSWKLTIKMNVWYCRTLNWNLCKTYKCFLCFLTYKTFLSECQTILDCAWRQRSWRQWQLIFLFIRWNKLWTRFNTLYTL